MTRPVLAARCPAKVNLLLRVLARRADGYHELDTVFQAIDLWDRLEVRPADTLSLTCDDPALPNDRTNLVLRAAECLARVHEIARPGAAFHLRKTIPVQAGLGGGSSDAAGALLLAARHWSLPVTRDELLPLARELGADVPFFLIGGRARGRGRGDHVEPLPHPGELTLLLGVPPFGVATREVFSRLATLLTLPEARVSVPIFPTHKWLAENDFASMSNDLERVVFAGWPELERFRDALLDAGARRALLSGSGSTVFGIFADDAEARRAASALEGRFAGWSLVRTRSVEEAVEVLAVDG